MNCISFLLSGIPGFGDIRNLKGAPPLQWITKAKRRSFKFIRALTSYRPDKWGNSTADVTKLHAGIRAFLWLLGGTFSIWRLKVSSPCRLPRDPVTLERKSDGTGGESREIRRKCWLGVSGFMSGVNRLWKRWMTRIPSEQDTLLSEV